MTLDDYRARIKEAVDSKQLAMLLYRALPLAYVDMGIVERVDQVRGLNVQVQLDRFEDKWKLWFNIGGPDMLKVLKHLDNEIFNRMSGGIANASAIPGEKYGVGFKATTTPFVVEQTFNEQEAYLRKKLSTQTSVESYWDTLMDAAPLYLGRALGWEHPNVEQQAYLLQKARPFQTGYLAMFKKHTMCDGRVTKGIPWSGIDLSSSSRTDFNSMIDSTHYPILQGCPFFELRSGGVRGYHLQNVDFSATAKALLARALEETTAYCFLHETNYIPIYALNERLRFERVAMPEMPYADFKSSL